MESIAGIACFWAVAVVFVHCWLAKNRTQFYACKS